MEPTSRRQFLKRSSAVAAAAGVAAAVPASAAKALGSRNKTDSDREPELPDHPTVDIPVVAHVRDVRKGIVTLYTDEREVTIKNKRLAAALYHATH
jgi:anaerobic selenocysteine-containing dehydrogenase